MKICMVGLFNYVTDARVRAYTEVLARAGAQVDVLGVESSTRARQPDLPGIRVFTFPINRTRRNALVYFFEYIFSFVLLGYSVTKLYLKERYDIIHFHNMPDFLVFSALVPRILGCKIILDIHDPMPEVFLSKYPREHGSLGYRLVCLEEWASARFSHAVIIANEHFKRNLQKRGTPAERITVTYNFPDPLLFDRSRYLQERAQPRDRFTLIFPGTLAPRYGLSVAIHALPLLRERIPNVRLLIIGAFMSNADYLVSLAEKLGVSDLLEVQPLMPNDAIPPLLARADIGIYPALPDAHMSIAIPGKILEYTAMGLPVVSSRLQIVQEMFDDSAVLFFEPGNHEQMAECILRLHDQPALREQLIRNADLYFVQKHAQDPELRPYWELISRLAPGR